MTLCNNFYNLQSSRVTIITIRRHQQKHSCPRLKLELFFNFPCPYSPPIPFLLLISATAADQQGKVLNTHKRWKQSNQSRENLIFNIPWFFMFLCYLWRTERGTFCSWSTDSRLWQASPSSLWTSLIWNDKELINYKRCFPFILHVVLLEHHLYLFPLSSAASPVFSCISNHFWCICSPGWSIYLCRGLWNK